MYLVPDVLRGVHDVSKERVHCCVGHQNIDAPALIQSLSQTQNMNIIEVVRHNLIIMGTQPKLV